MHTQDDAYNSSFTICQVQRAYVFISSGSRWMPLSVCHLCSPAQLCEHASNIKACTMDGPYRTFKLWHMYRHRYTYPIESINASGRYQVTEHKLH